MSTLMVVVEETSALNFSLLFIVIQQCILILMLVKYKLQLAVWFN